VLRLRYGVNADGAQAGRGKILSAIDRVEQEVQPSGYLVGDSFTVADLTAAALLFPLVRPPEAPHVVEGLLPAGFVSFRNSVADRRGFKWVEEIYREHRGTSAAIAA
jgi:glutathione S-transferase